jgi:hypothetical protein
VSHARLQELRRLGLDGRLGRTPPTDRVFRAAQSAIEHGAKPAEIHAASGEITLVWDRLTVAIDALGVSASIITEAGDAETLLDAQPGILGRRIAARVAELLT